MTNTAASSATSEEPTSAGHVLIVEDDDLSAEMLHAVLVQEGYEATIAANGREALQLIRSGLFRLVVSDWEMPEMSGVELCREIRQRHAAGYIYFILLTSRSDSSDVVAGLEAGADDFVTKPFQPDELRLRLRVAQRILTLESRDVTIFALAKLAESRDPETGAHLERIREYCRVLATHLAGQKAYQDLVDGQYVQMIYLTSPLHDIGKVGIPDHVLLKPGRFTAAEFEIMKQHTVIGGQTLDAAAREHPEARFLQMASEIAWTHHERFDGSGYPAGLAGEEIPLCGRIIALADVYDALTTKRVYKPAYDHRKVCRMICEGRGNHFDPAIVDAFLANEAAFIDIRRRFAEREAQQQQDLGVAADQQGTASSGVAQLTASGSLAAG